MTSAARKKIDTQTMQLFDPEVEKPEHDEIVRQLFEGTEELAEMLMGFHGLHRLVPFKESDLIDVVGYQGYSDRTVIKTVTIAEAVSLTKIKPTYSDLCPVRIKKRQMEPLMHLPTGDRSSRLIGFVDLGVSYTLVKPPYLVKDDGGSGVHWQKNEERHSALFEVKSVWPTSGALLRQLNLYAAASTSGFGHDGTSRVSMFAVGPDASLNDLICAHGYRLITHDPVSRTFTLQPGVVSPPEKDKRTES